MKRLLVFIIALAALLLSCEDGTRRILPNDNSATGDKDAVATNDDDTMLFEDTDDPATENMPTDDGTVTTDDGTVMNDDGEVVVTDDGTVVTDDGTVVNDDGEVVVTDDGTVAPDVDEAPCSFGDSRQIPCGLNNDGLQSQTCLGGEWQDQGSCVDPDVCINGDTQNIACGINGRGTQAQDCTGGQWVNDGNCDDPDECLDGAAQQISCGVGGNGTQDQNCTLGHWVNDGGCFVPGHWTCGSKTCTPYYGDAACGNGVCSPNNGESAKSCPADCDKAAVNGVGQNCSDVYDCAFYGWFETSVGYWTCSGIGQKKCAATKTTSYCGTNGYDYCYYGTVGFETDLTCAADCADTLLNQNAGTGCSSALDCIFLDWPEQ